MGVPGCHRPVKSVSSTKLTLTNDSHPELAEGVAVELVANA